MKLSAPSLLVIASALFALPSGVASARGNDSKAPDLAAPETAAPGTSSDTPSIQSSLGKYGDPGGARAYLKSKGITYQFSYLGEALGNTSGGVKRGATYEGIVYGKTDVDFGILVGLNGLIGHASAYNIHGRGLSGNNLQNFFVVSSIEAYPDTLLYEAWFEQHLADDKIAIRVGNLAADSDSEFFISNTAQLFVNSTFGWPTIYGTNLPSGGPAYPFGTPGVRVKLKPMDNVTLLAGLYNGDPAGRYIPGVNNIITQLRDPGGVNFRVKDPPLFITEGQFAYNQQKDSNGLPGIFKIGYLHHFEKFQSNDFANVNLRGNDSAYAIIDQTIFREKGTEDQGASIFARGSVMPSDRNIFDIYFDAGIAYKGLIPGRDDDTVGIGGGYGRISPPISQADILGGAAPLIRDYEALIEATYQFTVVPGFTLQPDFQYVFHPGAHGVADSRDGAPARDAAVFGLRTTIVY